jgi:uncharacterized surface protein with fasciclin (FAS1) repeats
MSHKKRIIILAIVITALLVFIGIFLFYVTKSSQQGTAPKTSTETASQDKQPSSTLANLISSEKTISLYEKYLKASALYVLLDTTNEYTVFAPNNGAFDKADSPLADIFNAEKNANSQKNILSYGIAKGIYKPASLSDGQKIKTLDGAELIIKKDGENMYITDMKGGQSHVAKAGLPAKNGSLYIVDAVPTPQ